MLHIVELTVSGLGLCICLSFLTDRIASDLFRHRPDAGVIGRER